MTDSKIANVAGLSSQPIKREKHPNWFPPAESAQSAPHTGLMVLNSLTETLEPFRPLNGRLVKWYTCGPTVYDVSHMGHARAYLTFDILRRIMEDYFGYNVFLQMNITDIDDKIIKGARILKLVDDFKKELNGDVAKLNAFVTDAVAFSTSVLAKREADLKVELPANAPSRVREERVEKLAELELKKGQLAEIVTKVAAARAAQPIQFDALFTAARNPIGDLLDSQKGRTIVDNSIFEAHARKFEGLYLEDMQRLGIREPDVITRVTEVVPEVVEFVKKIEANGFAYKGESSVFFDTEAFQQSGHNYPKLKPTSDFACGTTADEMAEGEGVLSATTGTEKKSPNDFALWKFSKPGEPAWDSPWGRGRPGWHIECSAMGSTTLGANMDIHAGGWDLKFPHHDNELAQSEAYWNHGQWVNYFFHCGHLHIKGLKMSKSLKNFVTIRQALEEITPREMRLLFLSFDWHKPMNFSDQSLGEAREKERVLRAFFGTLDVLFRQPNWTDEQGFTKEDTELHQLLQDTDAAVHAALCSNFNTPVAMVALLALVAETNNYLLTVKGRKSITLLKRIGRYITRILKVFGVVSSTDDIGLGDASSSSAADAQFVPAIDAFVSFRDTVRRTLREKKPIEELLKASDFLRDEALPVIGIRLEDQPDGSATKWKRDDPAAMRRELQERKDRDSQDKRRKAANVLETKTKLLNKWVQYAAPPTEFFRGDPKEAAKYSAYDAAGTPVTMADGSPVAEKAVAKLKKEQDKYAAGHKELQDKGGLAFLDEIRKEIAELNAILAS